VSFNKDKLGDPTDIPSLCTKVH